MRKSREKLNNEEVYEWMKSPKNYRHMKTAEVKDIKDKMMS